MQDANDSAMFAANPETWVDEHGDYLYRYAFSRLRDPNAAEEVVQESFLAGIRFQQTFTGAGAERAWLLGILKRKIVDHIRRRNRYDRDGVPEDTNDPSSRLFNQQGNWRDGSFSAMPDDHLASRELWDVVRDCLKNIPSGQADVFVLSAMEEMDSDKICQELGISPSNLWVRLHRARLALAKCVGTKWHMDQKVSNNA